MIENETVGFRCFSSSIDELFDFLHLLSTNTKNKESKKKKSRVEKSLDAESKERQELCITQIRRQSSTFLRHDRNTDLSPLLFFYNQHATNLSKSTTPSPHPISYHQTNLPNQSLTPTYLPSPMVNPIAKHNKNELGMPDQT